MTPLRRIYHAALGAAGIEVIGMGAGYIGQVMLARWLGPSGYGVFSWVTGLVLFLAIPTQLGLSVLILRDVSPRRIREVPGAVRGLLARAYQIAIGLALIVFVAGAGIDWLLLGDSVYRLPLALGLASLPFLVASALHIGAARAFGQIMMTKALADIGRPLMLLAGVGWALHGGWRPSPSIALLIFSIACVTVALMQYQRIRRMTPTALHAVKPCYDSRRWLVTAAPFALVAAIDVGMRQTDLIMVGLYLPAAEVGRYAAASRLATLVTLSLLAINMLAAPRYADLHQRGQRAAMQHTAAHLAHAMFWPALAIATGLLLAGPWLLAAFGPQFAAAYPPLLILVAGALVNVGAGSVGYLANLTGHQWWTVRIQGAAVIGNIVMNALFIPLFGLVGAAAATTISIAAANIGLHIVVARRVGVRPAIIFAFAGRA